MKGMTTIIYAWDTIIVNQSCMAEITARVKRKTPKYQTFIWGRGSDGQLGLKDQFDHNLPAVLACFNNKIVSQVACGGRHSLAVTSKGVDLNR